MSIPENTNHYPANNVGIIRARNVQKAEMNFSTLLIKPLGSDFPLNIFLIFEKKHFFLIKERDQAENDKTIAKCQ